MKLRVFWIVSIILAIVAIGIHVKAQDAASKAMKLIASAATATVEQKAILKTEANQYANQSGTIAIVGLGVAIGSAVCLLVSLRRREPAWRSIPFALLLFYVLLQFVIV